MPSFSRRRFLAAAAAATAVTRAQSSPPPVGLQLYAVNRALREDLQGTLRAVAAMGYEIVEFSANPYLSWTPTEAKRMRAFLDDLGLSCRSTHNEIVSFSGDGLEKAIELNQIIGSSTLVAVRGPADPTLDDWKRFNDQLRQAAERLDAVGMTVGFHNHGIEFQPLDGVYPADLLAANEAIRAHHLNIGLALQGGGDPVAFIHKVPGRLQSILVQDYQGQADWPAILAAAEADSAFEFYLIQRADGLGLVDRPSDDALDNVRQDLEYFRNLRS